MATKEDIISRAEEAVLRGMDDSDSRLNNAVMTFEALYPNAVRQAIDDLIERGENLQEVTTQYSISIVSGIGDLPEEVIKEYADMAQFPERNYVSYLPLSDYLRQNALTTKADILDFFTIDRNKIRYKKAGTASFSGTLKVNLVAVDEEQIGGTGDVPLTPKVIDRVVEVLTEWVSGTRPLPS